MSIRIKPALLVVSGVLFAVWLNTYHLAIPSVLTDNRWRAVELDGQSLHPDAGIMLSLQRGRASGSAGCNEFATSFGVSGSSIEFGSFGTTLAACRSPVMDRETAFLAALSDARTWAVVNDRLHLADGHGEWRVVFEPDGPP